MKRILIVHYSQSGQLSRVAQSIAAPLERDPATEVVYENLRPQADYPFPWSFFRFLDVFPESVYLDPPALHPLGVATDSEFDLVILAYQVWFLSPSLPVTAFLTSPEGRRLLKGRPVITVVACRNMWLTAQEKVKHLLAEADARHIDHIALVDQGSPLATFITTPRWVLTGRKDPLWGLFPPAGIAEGEIRAAARFGRAIAQGLKDGSVAAHRSVLQGLGAVNVDERLIASEKIGHRSFLIWGRLLRKVGRQGDPRRKPVLAIYVTFLILMIATVVPVTMLLKTALKPLTRRRMQREKAAYEQPSGSAEFRVKEFADG